ncbi:hypothetical protein EYC84_001906 [Monilinia fructicola]|uniref:Uncharacterized protein n=1 Tax=Monilinia fructicola TaxID=38448 RepID=A0A5M9JZ32_MONFR|nr:hypothetical protein EYC84_001906 [Monilinia fructicola]
MKEKKKQTHLKISLIPALPARYVSQVMMLKETNTQKKEVFVCNASQPKDHTTSQTQLLATIPFLFYMPITPVLSNTQCK